MGGDALREHLAAAASWVASGPPGRRRRRRRRIPARAAGATEPAETARGPQLPARGRVWGGSPSPSGKRLRAAGYLIEGCSQLSVYSVTKRLGRWTAATG